MVTEKHIYMPLKSENAQNSSWYKVRRCFGFFLGQKGLVSHSLCTLYELVPLKNKSRIILFLVKLSHLLYVHTNHN